MRTTLLNMSRTNQQLSYFSRIALSAVFLITLMFGYDSAHAQCDPNDTTGPTVMCRDVNTTFHPTTCTVAIWPKEVVFRAFDDTTPMEHLRITFDPEGRRNSITLRAEDGLRQTIDVYVTDLCGNQTVCRPTVDINDNTGQCAVNIFDLALLKTIATPGPFELGDTVTFDIDVFNQGSVDAFSIELTDFVPAGLILTDADWTLNGSTATLNNPIASLAAGLSTTVQIDFVISPAFTGTEIINVAEISGADDDMDPNNTPPQDEDSVPDAINGNDAGGQVDSSSDDVVNGDGSGTPGDTNASTDEDDQDPARIVIDRFDLSIQKSLVTSGPFELGDVVTFEIAVTNEGTLTGTNIGITEFPDAGLSFSSAATSANVTGADTCLLYTSPSPRDLSTSRMPSSA